MVKALDLNEKENSSEIYAPCIFNMFSMSSLMKFSTKHIS